MNETIPVITIDGPSGTGKGTISQCLAQSLGWHLLDSGALYRVLALAVKQHAIDLDNDEAIAVLAAHCDVQFKSAHNATTLRIIFEGADVTEAIRSEECGNTASIIAAISGVRQALLARQRAFRELPGLVTDGRDMGTVVFSDAQLKIYLEASKEERVKRRYKQLKEKGINVNLTKLHEELDERDRRDTEREVAPLKPAKDAFIIDTTGLSIEQVLESILEKVKSVFTAYTDIIV